MNTFRNILILLFIFIATVSVAEDPSFPSSDPLKLVTSNKELHVLKKLAVVNWREVVDNHINRNKANFFYIDNPVDFIEYLEGNHIPQGIRFEEARDAVEETIGFTAMYASNGLYSKEEIDYYIRKSRDFWNVRYCPIQLREAFYANYRLLLYLRSKIAT